MDPLKLILLHCKLKSYLRSSKIKRLALISKMFSQDTKATTGKFRQIN